MYQDRRNKESEFEMCRRQVLIHQPPTTNQFPNCNSQICVKRDFLFSGRPSLLTTPTTTTTPCRCLSKPVPNRRRRVEPQPIKMCLPLCTTPSPRKPKRFSRLPLSVCVVGVTRSLYGAKSTASTSHGRNRELVISVVKSE